MTTPAATFSDRASTESDYRGDNTGICEDQAQYLGAAADEDDRQRQPPECGRQSDDASDVETACSRHATEARHVHERLRTLQTCGNEIRHSLLVTMCELFDRKMCLELGYTSFPQYCDRELGLPRSTAYEYVRAGKALKSLPELRRQFKGGYLSWVQVRAITRVATPDTEVSWIELAWLEPVRTLLDEVREAQRTGRDAPRQRRYGLPNLYVDLGVKVTLEERERILTAFSLVRDALAVMADREEEGDRAEGACASGDTRNDLGLSDGMRPALVRWADAVLAGLLPISARVTNDTDLQPGPTPAQTIVYHTCPDCRQSTVETRGGRVSVTAQRIAALAPHATEVHIDDSVDDELEQDLSTGGNGRTNDQTDAPNSPRLTRQVIHRDGLRCANPACGRRHDLHAHHIVFRAAGGRSALSNEVTVCATCHGLIHEGLLEIEGDLDTGLKWLPRPMDPETQVRDTATLARRVQALVAEHLSLHKGEDSRVDSEPPDVSPRETPADGGSCM